MPIQGPIWSGRARDVYEEDEALRYRKAADEKLRRLQAMPSAKLGPDTPMRGPRANGPRGWQINPKGIETQNGMAGGSAMPANAPPLDSAERDMTMLGPSPRLSARDIAGDPVPANAQEGIGGPDQDIAEMARAELERRKSQGSPADPQAQAMQELARRQGAASQPPGDNTQDGFALDVLRRQGMLPPEQTGGVGTLPEIQQAAPKLPTRPQVYMPPPGPPAAPSGAQAFMANTFQSATFGQGDKIRGGVAAALGGNYDNEVARSREWLKQAREKEPGYSFLGEAAGFLWPGAAIGKGVGLATRGAVNGVTRMAPALNFAARTGAAAAEGAVGGAAYGYTTGAENRAIDQGAASPGLLAQERIDSTGSNAAMGAVFGGAMPAVDVMTRPVRNFIGGAVSRIAEPFAPGAVAAHNKRIAAGAARRAFERAGIVTVDDLVKRAAKYGDKPVVAGELSQGTLNNLTNIVRRPGTSADKAMAVLEDRVAGMPGRMLKDIAEETGLQPDEVMGSIEDMVKAGRERAAPLYTTAEEAPFAETANLERIVKDAPILQGLMSKAKNRVQNQAVAQIGQADQMPPLKIYDELKQLVDEEIQARITNGQGIDDIQGVRDVLVRELDNISGQAATGLEVPPAGSSLYAAAREAGGDAPRIKQGLKDGGGALSGAKMADEVAREVADIRGQQLTAYQIGVIRSMVKGVENGTLTPKRVKTLGFQKKLNEVFGEPAAKGLIQKFGVEAELSQKGSRWNANVGSVTSQATLGGPSKAGDEVLRAATNAATGNKIGLITQAIDGLRRMGYSEKQLDEIGNIFLSTPDDAAKAMFPGQSPKPGSIPPPTPPAGMVRTNPPAPPQGPPPAGQNTYKQLTAQADEAWKNGQWELANDLQRQANALKAGPPPKTEAPSKGGADGGPIVKNGLFPSKQPLPMDEASRINEGRLPSGKVDIYLPEMYGGVNRTLSRNPTSGDINRILNRSQADEVRWVKDIDGNMYVGDAIENVHDFMFKGLSRNGVKVPTKGDANWYSSAGQIRKSGKGWEIEYGDENWTPFDPAESGSSKLLAGMGASPEAVGGIGGAAAGYFGNPSDANQDGVIDDKDRGLNAMGGLMSGVLGGNIAKRGVNAMRNITPPKGPPSASGSGNSVANAAEELTAQAADAWNKGQWELANDLQRQANALKAGPPPKTEAPSQGGAVPAPQGQVRVYRGVRAKNSGEGGDAFYTTNPDVARKYSDNGEIEAFNLNASEFSKYDAVGSTPKTVDVYGTRDSGKPGAVFSNVGDLAIGSGKTVYNPVTDVQYYVVDPKRLTRIDATKKPRR